ncbi:MAG: arsenite methyltransferase [Phycisphaeraceae bacterium]|nr:arsenite methyltransferase [Phycisphaeraceae bacterium]
MATTRDDRRVREQVREGYSKIATEGVWVSGGPTGEQSSSGCCGGGGCCGGVDAEAVARTVGYDEAELATLPEGANMGLSCGNPTAIAGLREGEVLLDLGSGGGFDCFLAGPKVGACGRVIGVDMTPAMIDKARRNVESYRRTTGLDNVEFRLGEIENLPVADSSVDVVISNCVLNLSPSKDRVWSEIARVLKPGGRVAVSDLALLRPLPEGVRTMVEALVGCVSGAVLAEETRRQMEAAGLTEIRLTPKAGYVDAMQSWQDPLYQKILAALPAGTKPGDYITSLDIEAVRPTGEQASRASREADGSACCAPGCCG